MLLSSYLPNGNEKADEKTAKKDKPRHVDLGCGLGNMLVAAKSLGYATYGIENDPSHALAVRGMGFTVKEMDLKEWDGSGLEDVNVVTCYFVPSSLEILKPALGKLVETSTENVVVCCVEYEVPGVEGVRKGGWGGLNWWEYRSGF